MGGRLTGGVICKATFWGFEEDLAKKMYELANPRITTISARTSRISGSFFPPEGGGEAVTEDIFWGGGGILISESGGGAEETVVGG